MNTARAAWIAAVVLAAGALNAQPAYTDTQARSRPGSLIQDDAAQAERNRANRNARRR